MKTLETCIEPADVKPILADALMLIKDKAYTILRALTKRAEHLPEGWEHIEDALVVQEGKSDRIATAFCKVFRKRAPQAIWIEYGHRLVGHRPKATWRNLWSPPQGRDTGKFVTANPFFRPAIDMKRAEVRATVAKGIKSLIMRAANGGAGISPDDTGWIG